LHGIISSSRRRITPTAKAEFETDDNRSAKALRHPKSTQDLLFVDLAFFHYELNVFEKANIG
jgi:hypothetical protein